MTDVVIELFSLHFDSGLYFGHHSLLCEFVCILAVECQLGTVPQPFVVNGGAVRVSWINLVVQPFPQSVYPFSSISSLYIGEE